MKKWLLLLTLWQAYCCAWAAVSVTDDKGRKVAIAQAPKRIISLLPSLTETVCALGRCQDLVGVDRYSNYPEAVHKLPQLGGGLDPQIEAIFALKPDLVLAASSSPGTERLAALGLTVLQLEPKDQADAVRVIRTLAQALFVADPEPVIRQMDLEFMQAQALLPAGARGKKIYFEVSSGPYAAGAASFIGQTISQLGLVNIVGPELGPFPKINPELVVRAQPDVVVIADSSFSALAQRPGWGMVRALKEQKVCTFSSADGDLLVRPGPRMGQGALLLTRCLARLYAKGQTP